MAVFGVILDNNHAVKKYIKGIKDRVEYLSFIENPFIFNIINKGDLYIIIIKPLYFNFCMFGWLIVLSMLIFIGWSYWLIPPVLLGLGSVFWWSRFYYYMFKLGLKKNGYRGKLRYLTARDILENIYLKK